jgi:hypothetical protein
MTVEELQAISKTSNAVITILGKPYKWIQSFVTEDKIYCIHEAKVRMPFVSMLNVEIFQSIKLRRSKLFLTLPTAEMDN